VPEVVEPGTRLVQRYRLERRLEGAGADAADGADGADAADAADRADGTGSTARTPWTYWRAEDELLARPVSVCLIDANGSTADAVLDAARRAAALPDPRFLRVLDAARVDGLVYVVSEWVAATDLAGLLADGPLPAAEARALATELAEAISTAHDAGLSHLCLQPEHVLRTAHGQLKVAGLAVDAAARGIGEDDPTLAAERDVHGIGAVLYAALTARWPGETVTALPPAPWADDAPCHPRQVRAGVPHDLDELTCRALSLPGTRKGGLADPRELARELDAGHGGTTRLPAVGPDDRPDRRVGPSPVAPAPAAERASDDEPRSRSRAVVLAWVAAAVVLVTGLVLFGGQLVLTALDGDDSSPAADEPAGSGSDGPGAAEVRRLGIAGVRAFDPEGDGEEHDEQAGLVADRDPSTAWTTVDYFDPMELQKSGVGLVVDLGAPADVSEVVIRPQGGPTDIEVRVSSRARSALSGYQPFDRTSNATGPTTLRVAEPVRTRYLLVWLTRLPAVDGQYIGSISEVTVRGTTPRSGT
jgi:putative peptidoglycan lipid II flippase